MKTCPGCRGLTLVEVAVVLAITAILCAAIAYGLASIRSEQDQMAAQTIQTHLQYARDVAVNRELTTKVEFSVLLNQYSLYVADTNAPGGFRLLSDPLTQGECIMSISEKHPGIELSSVNIDGGSLVYFSQTNGIPYNASGTPLASIATISLATGSKVRITPLTGYVSISR